MVNKSLWLILLTLFAFVGLIGVVAGETVAPVSQKSMTVPRIFAYRAWQSVGVRVRAGDELWIRADGNWMYTPGEYHGPGGHARYLAPAFYPLPSVPGGALIGRVGENGDPFFVGRGGVWRMTESGLLYLRIDDDILSDNDGAVKVEVTVVSPSPTPD